MVCILARTMVVLIETKRETPQKARTAFDRIMREWSPLPDSKASNTSRRLDFIRRVQKAPSSSGRHNPTTGSVANSEGDQRAAEVDQQTSSLTSGIIRNHEQLEVIYNRAFPFTNAGSTSESSNSHAREFRSEASSFSPRPNGPDIHALIYPRSKNIRPSLARDPDIPEFQYFPTTFRPWRLTFRQACSVMAHFQCPLRQDLILRTILGHSLLIYGIPADYPVEDLWLVVFFFIEQYFCIQAEFEYCAKNLRGEKDPSAVGVVFKKMTVRYDLLNKRHVLVGTRYRMEPNIDVSWIADL